jgi:glucokinase-like ROK family protein
MDRREQPTANSNYINKLNKIRILSIIRNHKNISRADLAKESKISAPTVTRIVNSLTNKEGLIKEVGIGRSTGGRKPILVEFAAEDNYVIGIDIGRTHIDGVLANLNSEIINEIQLETNLEDGFYSIMKRISEIIFELRNDTRIKGKKIFGVGMAVAGLINRVQNIVEFSPDFHWENVDIEKSLQRNCDLPIKFDNVTRVMALGELWYGVGKYIKNFIVINVGYGIGAGIIINGEPLYGPFGMAGEIGHITMDKSSDYLCDCGNYGCLEALSSGRAIAHRMKSGIKAGKKTILIDWVDADESLITAKLVAKAAREGDQLAGEIFDEAVEYLGMAIANVIDIFSTECILIGGGVAQADDLVFEKVKEIVKKRSLRANIKRVQIKGVTFGMKSATKGALALILKEVLNLNLSE